MGIDQHKQKFDKLLANGNYPDALRLLFSILDCEPSLSNYNFAASRLKRFDLSSMGFRKVRIALLSSFTIEPIVSYLHVKCCRGRLDSQLYIGGYNLFQQEILDPKSKLYGFNPDVLILAVRLHELNPRLYDSFSGLSEEEIRDEVSSVVQQIESLISVFRSHSNAIMVIHNFETPVRTNLGIMDHQQHSGQKNSIHEINVAIEDISRRVQGVYILDYDNLASLHGKLNWQDDRMWFLGKIPISGKNWIYLADEYMRFLQPLKGLNRKCLVLDLDNTLWGGILGEDGIDGIKLGNTYPGNAFREFQREILKLYDKGIILAINSKNNEDNVLEVLEKHPDMLLRKKHFATMRVNWQNKMQNMREIAEDLNIGLDSIIFIDDSPAERELMRMGLPDVLTIDMPAVPEQYCKALMELTSLEVLSLSEEDRKRGEMYQAQVVRKKLQKSAASLEDFYRALDMTAIIKSGDSYSIPRISQLTQRTNQFNLTTRRYTENDIVSFVKSPDHHVFYLQLQDKYGDSGIVGVAIVYKGKSSWDIDTFLLSCRVLGRTVETAFLFHIVTVAREENVKYIYGSYIPTKKNKPAEALYQNHCFELYQRTSGEVRWVLDIEKGRIECPEWIKLEVD